MYISYSLCWVVICQYPCTYDSSTFGHCAPYLCLIFVLPLVNETPDYTPEYHINKYHNKVKQLALIAILRGTETNDSYIACVLEVLHACCLQDRHLCIA